MFCFSFVEWTDEVLSSKEDSVVNHFRLLGVMEALAAIFKVSFFFCNFVVVYFAFSNAPY